MGQEHGAGAQGTAGRTSGAGQGTGRDGRLWVRWALACTGRPAQPSESPGLGPDTCPMPTSLLPELHLPRGPSLHGGEPRTGVSHLQCEGGSTHLAGAHVGSPAPGVVPRCWPSAQPGDRQPLPGTQAPDPLSTGLLSPRTQATLSACRPLCSAPAGAQPRSLGGHTSFLPTLLQRPERCEADWLPPPRGIRSTCAVFLSRPSAEAPRTWHLPCTDALAWDLGALPRSGDTLFSGPQRLREVRRSARGHTARKPCAAAASPPCLGHWVCRAPGGRRQTSTAPLWGETGQVTAQRNPTNSCGVGPVVNHTRRGH